MRAACAAVTLAAAVAAGVPAAAIPATAVPRLAVTTQPLVIHGARFAPRERVRVTVVVYTMTVRRTVATTDAGTFAVPLAAVAPNDPCMGSLRVIAIGASGDRATLKRPPRECPPPP